MTIGLTGGIGSGKSTVAKVLESMGYSVFYSDHVAKELMTSDHDLQLEITSHFGENAYENGKLNRTYLAERIFSNVDDRAVLNNLIHPRVRASFTAFAQSSNSELVFNEAAILFETGAYSSFGKNILVTAPVESRIERVMKRDKCSREDVQNRMNNQWSDGRKMALSDFVIKNGDSDAVLDQIETIVESLLDHSTSS